MTDPQGLVDDAIKRQDKRGKEIPPIDGWWVICNTESRQDQGRRRHLPSAIKKACSQNINLIIDSPSIEYWLLLHFEYTTRDFETADDCRRELKKYLPDYSKNRGQCNWSTVTTNTRQAMLHGTRIRKARQSGGTKRPIADLDVLMGALIGLSNKKALKMLPLPTTKDLYILETFGH